MSTLCTMLRTLIEDEEKAPKHYSKLRAKMIGHPTNKALIDEIISDENKHHKNLIKIAKDHHCKIT